MDKKNDYIKTFPTRLRELMKENNITQQKLADEIGITRQTVSQYMDGSAQPTLEKIFKIAYFFNTSSDYLLGLSDVRAFKSVDVENEVKALKAQNDYLIEKLNRIAGLVKECKDNG